MYLAMKRTKRAAIYARISNDNTQEDGEGLGVARQVRLARERCTERGFEIVGVYEDNDVSGYSGKRRRGFEALCASIRDGEVDVVVAFAPDRLTRHPRELENLIDLLEESRTAVETIVGGAYDLTTPGGRNVARILGSVARLESETKSARLRAKQAELARAGKLSGGGNRLFGYRKVFAEGTENLTGRGRRLIGLEIEPTEEAHVREAAARILAGASLRATANYLNALGVTSTLGNKWDGSSLKQMLCSPSLAGFRVHPEAGTVKAAWPAIISLDEHKRLCAILGSPERNVSRGRDKHLLTDRLVCGGCGRKMVSMPLVNGKRTYFCKNDRGGCGRKIAAESLELHVFDTVREAVKSGNYSRVVATVEAPDNTSEATLAELADIERRGEVLAEMFAAGEIGRTEWRAARDGLDARRVAAEARLGSATVIERRQPVTEGDIDNWDELPRERQRDIIARVLPTIIVGPAKRGANKFDACRISLPEAPRR